MKKFTFLMAFLATVAFAMPSWAMRSPDDDDGGWSHGVSSIEAKEAAPLIIDVDDGGQSSGASSKGDDSGLVNNNTATPSGSEVTKSRPFTPAEAAAATKNDGKNSVTINF